MEGTDRLKALALGIAELLRGEMRLIEKKDWMPPGTEGCDCEMWRKGDRLSLTVDYDGGSGAVRVFILSPGPTVRIWSGEMAARPDWTVEDAVSFFRRDLMGYALEMG